MKKERTTIELRRLKLNEGQLEWLPRNPRQWTKDALSLIVKSIKEDPDFLEDRPALVGPLDGTGDFVVFAGNFRCEGARAAKVGKVPCIVYEPEDADDRITVIRRAIKDNGQYGEWDPDILANEWDDMPLADWGMPSWVTGDRDGSGLNLSTKGREGEDADYDAFVDKFKQKLTTDDCYTPHGVFDAVRNFVDKYIVPLKGKTVLRPFVPGGDYEHYDYPDNGIVIDNPPFSILSKILRFYHDNSIPFFLFAPSLTLFTAADCDLTYIVTSAGVVYENGAVVKTGFITNLVEDLRIWLCPELADAIEDAQEKEDKTKRGFVYPDNIVTAATLGKIVERSVELKIPKVACEYIHESDSAKEQGRGLYGGGFILAERAAAERAAAERAAATRLNLSERERAIIARLDEQYH